MQLTAFFLAISSTLAIKFTVQYSPNGDYSQRTPRDLKVNAGICYKLPYNWYEVTIPSGYKTLFWKDENCKDRFNAESNNPEFDLYDINRYLSLKSFKIVESRDDKEGKKFWWLGGNFGDDVFGGDDDYY
ncbi:hypothetical protein CONCODRAFT_80609 [Conidiobolus coronatus NRRL 28638]|uniref:Uncharacterized protein n=1 Tax=Conidiobolus coronatus (strain ATCC 28846 / CBS 209.66 / NRRL 28638) TaxID=796925 RepID=A0A137NTB7_CONC2|nr:hypothetical protein CONCODRAFT_80609 [Conidiobolus coronatus NRRL 28638]|eukprot:KXN66047.1 hypothetical protein CONCODRAFT_80609 [Conidiobolus coronatus NRRL 28638]